MKFASTLPLAFAALSAAQTLNIPTRVGSIVSLSSPSVISGSKDFGNKEYDRGRDCDTDDDTGSESAVFILENGATLSNVSSCPASEGKKVFTRILLLTSAVCL